MAYLKQGADVPTKGKGSKLSLKMGRFVDEYMTDFNASAAVLRVPYKTTNPNRVGAELLRHPLVIEEIKRRTEKKRENMELKADYLINKLIAIIEDGDIKTADTLRAIELAGKSIALWKERQEISGPDGQAIEYEQRVKEDVADFTSKLARLAESARKDGVVEFPKSGGSR